ncbi:MAG: hypothetical protein CYPHOPRED_004365 [Cyphobasidiales sp. Tagirdzhanova-0007]|nr:MAG: hypothetical protein CYPHOPRED_004365 [Cyphobasidiales sp. Tagirdzhanova-0007]
MSQLYRDPWAKREAWRKHPVFSNRAMFSNLFPGLGIAIVAFGAYVLADNLIHPDNIEELKRQARESASRPTMLSLLRGKGIAGDRQGKAAAEEEEEQ